MTVVERRVDRTRVRLARATAATGGVPRPDTRTRHLGAAPLLAGALVVALLLAQVASHRDEGGWVAKGNVRDTVTLDGHLVEWEWFHFAEPVRIIQDPQHRRPETNSQNIYRFTGAYLIALLNGPIPSLYAATVAATVLAWLAAAWALYALATEVAGTPWAGVVAAGLVATSPGFIGYLGNVDAHPFGYAAVALWLAAVERLRLLDGGHRDWRRPVLAGLLLCIAGYTLEVAYPLFGFAWIVYGLPVLWRREAARTRLAALVIFTLVFAASYGGFRLLIERVLFTQVSAFNNPLHYLGENAADLRATGLWSWLGGRAGMVAARWTAAFPVEVSLLALAGLATLSRRWRSWALTWAAVAIGAVAVTKPAVRDMYFAYPAIYVAAGCGAAAMARVVARQRVPFAPVLAGVALVGLLAIAVVQVNADWWGDYGMPIRWFLIQ